MDTGRFDEILARTLDDRKLSRGERKALTAILEEAEPDANARAALRSRVFEAALGVVHDPRDKAILEWVSDMMKVLHPVGHGGSPERRFDASFSPGESCRNRIVGLLKSARQSADICVFTITDNAIAQCIEDAHQRGVRVRVISDDDKSGDLGSDIESLRRSGVPVAIDRSDAHMHHKFAIFDGDALLTGSYNWTRSAASANQENLVVLNEPSLVRAFQREFDRLWDNFRPNG